MNSLLNEARDALEIFESSLLKKPLPHKLCEGLEILDELVVTSDEEDAKAVANNLAKTYIKKVYDFAKKSLEDRAITESELEKLNDILIEVKESAFGVKDEVEAIRNKVIAGLIKHYFTGYSKEEQVKIIKNITSIDT